MLKVPISLIWRLNIRIVIYLDGMLLLGRWTKEALVAADTDFLVATSRICIQPPKVHSDSLTKNRVFRSASAFSQHVTVFGSRQTYESGHPMFGDVQDRESVLFIIGKAHRSSKFNNTRSVTYATSLLVFTVSGRIREESTNSGRITQSRPFISI